MEFVWPIKMLFVIAYVDDDYHAASIARERRDFVWIIAAEPEINALTYGDLVQQVAELGYDVDRLRMVPQPTTAAR